MNRITATLAVLLTVLVTQISHAAELGDDGLYKQPFFADTFLELGEDLAEATDQGKDLLIIWEQFGCPYCKEMHLVNFAREDIPAYIAENYMVIQLNMWGAREVTDFDGEVMEERELARRWFINFTPTTQFFVMDDPDAPPQSVQEALVFTLPGYFKPFHHLSALEYVATDGYKEQPNFQRWLQAKADRMREEGQEVTIWE